MVSPMGKGGDPSGPRFAGDAAVVGVKLCGERKEHERRGDQSHLVSEDREPSECDRQE